MRESPYIGTVSIGFSVYFVRGVDIRLRYISFLVHSHLQNHLQSRFRRMIFEVGELQSAE